MSNDSKRYLLSVVALFSKTTKKVIPLILGSDYTNPALYGQLGGCLTLLSMNEWWLVMGKLVVFPDQDTRIYNLTCWPAFCIKWGKIEIPILWKNKKLTLESLCGICSRQSRNFRNPVNIEFWTYGLCISACLHHIEKNCKKDLKKNHICRSNQSLVPLIRGSVAEWTHSMYTALHLYCITQ